jgi:peroxisomal enoyl-CoA hydratase 2
MLGFKRPILHGLCSYGTAAHSVIKHMAGNDASRFKSIHARFSSPVYPGGKNRLEVFERIIYIAITNIIDTIETLVTSMWKVSESGDEEIIRFVTKIKERDAVVIKDGFVTLSKAKSSAKL